MALFLPENQAQSLGTLSIHHRYPAPPLGFSLLFSLSPPNPLPQILETPRRLILRGRSRIPCSNGF